MPSGGEAIARSSAIAPGDGFHAVPLASQVARPHVGHGRVALDHHDAGHGLRVFIGAAALLPRFAPRTPARHERLGARPPPAE
jgi:hypothetical protein